MISGGGYPQPRADVWIYNFEEDTTVDMADMLVPRALHGAVVAPDGVFVFGGNGDEQEPIESAESLEAEDWTKLPDMPQATSAAVAVEHDDIIYITGHSI